MTSIFIHTNIKLINLYLANIFYCCSQVILQGICGYTKENIY
ncbi:Uncharacterised protein [Klebsiella pneumoniae]|nr:Uncharacterised protein [Klebsiella pneumoniae]